MDRLNYHHLFYFWSVAREGSLRRASEVLRVSPPSMSVQIRQLEEALGQPLFRRSGRGQVLSEAGRTAFSYADEIFALGGELAAAVRGGAGQGVGRLSVGVTDGLPKLAAYALLRPVLAADPALRLTVCEAGLGELIDRLAAYRLDVVLANEPPPSLPGGGILVQALGESATAFLAAPRMARKLRRGFPASLDRQPVLLPPAGTPIRQALEAWFARTGIAPRLVGEIEDSALAAIFAAEGAGFIPLPAVVMRDARDREHLEAIGTTEEVRESFHLLVARRRRVHPALGLITRESLREWLVPSRKMKGAQARASRKRR